VYELAARFDRLAWPGFESVAQAISTRSAGEAPGSIIVTYFMAWGMIDWVLVGRDQGCRARKGHRVTITRKPFVGSALSEKFQSSSVSWAGKQDRTSRGVACRLESIRSLTY